MYVFASSFVQIDLLSAKCRSTVDEQGKARVIVRKGGNADCILPPHPGPLSAFPKRTTGRTRCSPLRTVPTDSLGLVYSHPIHPVHHIPPSLHMVTHSHGTGCLSRCVL